MPLLPSRLTRVLRRLVRVPLFTTVAAMTLAVGIGANTAIFSVVYGVLLKPLPFRQPDRVVGVWHTAPGINIPLLNQSPATYLTYRDSSRVFEDIGLWDTAAASVTGSGEPERISVLLVTDGVLPLLGVQPFLGRSFDRIDDSRAAPERVMLAYGYWQRKFGEDRNILGRLIQVDGTPREVIGVLRPDFRFLNTNPQMVLPFRFDPSQVFVGNFSYQGVARLKPGVTIEQANADVARMLPLTLERYRLPPGFTRKMFDDARIGPLVRPLAEDVIGNVRRVLWVMLGTVAIVFLIACANVANLFLVRAEGRQQELAVHAALGASWRRLTTEILSESVTLGLLGGAVGLLLAYAGVAALRWSAPQGLPRIDDITIGAPVLMFAVLISIFAGLIFGLIPVLRFASPNVAGALKEGGRLSSAGRERHRVRNTLVVGQIALAVILLVASGLMIRTFQAMRHVEPGFTRPEQVLTLRVSIPESLVRDAGQTALMHEHIAERIAQIPGVRSVGLSTSITLDAGSSYDPVTVEDFPTPEGRIPPIRRFKWLGAGYVETMGNRVLAGRTFTWTDIHNRAHVAIVNEKFAREYWKDPAAALGKRIKVAPANPWRTIIGIVGDERDDSLARPSPATVYWPMLQEKFWDEPVAVQRTIGYVVRSERTGSEPLLKEIQQAVWSVNPNLPVARVRTLERVRDESMAQTSFALVLLAISSAVALLLGIVGIYGVLAYIVTQRTREIGIRMALGAAERDVSRLFLRYGLLLTSIGVVLGLIGAAATTRVMEALLYGVSAVDPATYAIVAVCLAAVTLLASYVPASRAARIEPAVALRRDG
jgi:putative ABC transport system permease protein